jgi:hypothetical protein
MSPEDPRFKTFQEKKFLQVDTGRVHEIRDWVDPRDLQEPNPDPTPAPASSMNLRPTMSGEVPPERFVQEAQNTPNRRGQILSGKKSAPSNPKSVSDPWEVKKPPEGQVVKPGAKIRFGGKP